ncbi:fimbrial protein [Providencia stuartii]|uniref:fimbrial protein n=1 Tax=Providencia stuartii TaxID=588 RepID=UPI00111D55A9|nr:fimbrial protein [Providencia stuartii]
MFFLKNICFFFLFYSGFVLGSVSCQQISSEITVNTTLAPSNIYGGSDLSLGSIIYRGDTRQNSRIPDVIKCTGTPNESFSYTYQQKVLNPPLPLSNWQGSPYPGKVYQSGVPGIGVAIVTDSGEAITHLNSVSTINTTRKLSSSGSLSFSISNASTRLVLIKIGEVTPGSYVFNSSNLPVVQHIIDNSPGNPSILASPLSVFRLMFSGSMSVNAQTCLTPNANVEMGSYNIHSDFSGIGSVTQWVDVNLLLKDCPIFYGFYNDSNYPVFFDANNGGVTNIPPSIANSIGVRLTPNTQIITDFSGVMAIDAESTISASGVGIQMGWGDSSKTIFDFSQEKTLNLPKDGRTNIRIPLFARYIQTDQFMTPGLADGQLTFTINYY